LSIDKDDLFMSAALDAARMRKKGKYFGAVVVCKGKMIASAFTTTVEDNDPTNHAEIKAIREAARSLNSRRLNGCTLYSTCEPCMMCTAAALWAQIDEIVFALSSADFPEYFEHSQSWQRPIESLVPSTVTIRRGILKDEVAAACREQLRLVEE